MEPNISDEIFRHKFFQIFRYVWLRGSLHLARLAPPRAARPRNPHLTQDRPCVCLRGSPHLARLAPATRTQHKTDLASGYSSSKPLLPSSTLHTTPPPRCTHTTACSS